MPDTSDKALRADYEASLRMAGIVVPADRDQAMFDAFKMTREMMDALHRPWRYDEEPAHIQRPVAPEGSGR
jgi:hypothetical protein